MGIPIINIFSISKIVVVCLVLHNFNEELQGCKHRNLSIERHGESSRPETTNGVHRTYVVLSEGPRDGHILWIFYRCL